MKAIRIYRIHIESENVKKINPSVCVCEVRHRTLAQFSPMISRMLLMLLSDQKKKIILMSHRATFGDFNASLEVFKIFPHPLEKSLYVIFFNQTLNVGSKVIRRSSSGILMNTDFSNHRAGEE